MCAGGDNQSPGHCSSSGIFVGRTQRVRFGGEVSKAPEAWPGDSPTTRHAHLGAVTVGDDAAIPFRFDMTTEGNLALDRLCKFSDCHSYFDFRQSESL